jgi:hypothetical protein
MAIITNLNQLNPGGGTTVDPVSIDTTAKTIELVIDSSNNLSADGVDLQTLYSYCKEAWKSDPTLIKHPFPFLSITSESFELVNGWDFANTATKLLIKSAGWSVMNTSNVATESWAGIITLGSLVAGTQVYYELGTGYSTLNFSSTNEVNEAVNILTTIAGTPVDLRSNFRIFARNPGATFAQSGLDDIGVTSMQAQVYRFPLATIIDQNVDKTDGQLNTTALNAISYTYYPIGSEVTHSFGGTPYDFSVVIDGNGQSISDIYQRSQLDLRSGNNINTDTSVPVIGKTSDSFCSFVGSDLIMATGVYLDNFDPTDSNKVKHNPTAGLDLLFPFIAGLKLEFSTHLINDSAAEYAVFFAGANFGTPSAVIVEDSSVTPVNMAGSISNNSEINLTYSYTNNTQRGPSSGDTDVPIVVVAIGLNTGQYIAASGTITRSDSNVVSLVSSIERNYSTPS